MDPCTNYPSPVLGVIDYIIESAIEESAKNTLKPIIEKLINKVFQYGSDYLINLQLSRRKIKNKPAIIQHDDFIHRGRIQFPKRQLSTTESMKMIASTSNLKTPLSARFKTVATEERFSDCEVLNKSHVKFGTVKEICILQFPDDVKKTSQRRPTMGVLTSTATADTNAFISKRNKSKITLRGKKDLERSCIKTMGEVEEIALKIVAAAIEPITRQSTIQKLAKIRDADVEEIAMNIAKEILGLDRPVWSINFTRNKKKMPFKDEAACLISRKAVKNTLKPPSFQPKKNDEVLNYKIMFINHFK